MNKNEFIEAVNEQTKLTKKECKMCLEVILNVIKHALKNGESVNFTNFGKFKISKIKAKPIYNFKTGKTNLLQERNSLTFKASENLKQIVK